MPRELSSELETASTAPRLTPIALVELLFDSGPFRVWSGWGTLVWQAPSELDLVETQRMIPGGVGIDETGDDETMIPGSLGVDQSAELEATPWYGIGDLGTVGAIEETTEVRAVGLELGLSGVSPEVLEIALAEDWQGREAHVYLGILDAQGQLDGEPTELFGGKIDRMVLSEDKVASVSIAIESEMIDLERTRPLRYTPEIQRGLFEGDAFCDAVSAIQEVDVNWGVAA